MPKFLHNLLNSSFERAISTRRSIVVPRCINKDYNNRKICEWATTLASIECQFARIPVPCYSPHVHELHAIREELVDVSHSVGHTTIPRASLGITTMAHRVLSRALCDGCTSKPCCRSLTSARRSLRLRRESLGMYNFPFARWFRNRPTLCVRTVR